jgi:hypothetical protein
MPDEHGFLAPAEIPTIYSNTVRLATSVFDFRLYFGEIIPQQLTDALAAGEQSQLVGRIADRLCVVIPPETAKAMIQALTKSVADFETKARPILNPNQGMIPPLQKKT